MLSFLYHSSASQPLLRDFTYVADTVGGILSALDHTPLQCGEVYNLGYGQPVAITTMLDYLQEELGQKAVLVCELENWRSAHLSTHCVLPLLQEHSPLPPADLSSTFADISDSKRVLGFHPNISLREGGCLGWSYPVRYAAANRTDVSLCH